MVVVIFEAMCSCGCGCGDILKSFVAVVVVMVSIISKGFVCHYNTKLDKSSVLQV